MGQQLSFAHNEQLSLAISNGDLKTNAKGIINHEGILRFQSMPFRGSTQIAKSPALFLENADYTLKDILESRLNTTRLLTEEDLLRLLESVLYTLAYLQSKGIVYKDLAPQNIYYFTRESTFKLLPPELIENSSYQLMQQGARFSLISPEMLIALRQQQPSIDDDTYHKSNVFTLGMIMLEAATLQSSCLCYQDNTLDILDRAVQNRLQLVREMYPPEFAALLENMLEYDCTKRMSPKQLALYLNQYFSKSNIKSRIVQPQKLYLTTHPNVKMYQSKIPPAQKSNVMTNNLIDSKKSTYTQQNKDVMTMNTTGFSPAPTQAKAVYREFYTPSKIIRPPQTLKAQLIPPQVLQYISGARHFTDNPQFSNRISVTPPKYQFNKTYTQTRQSVLSKYSRARNHLLTDGNLQHKRHSSFISKSPMINNQKRNFESPLKEAMNSRYEVPISSAAACQFNRLVRFTPSPNSPTRPQKSSIIPQVNRKVSTLLPPKTYLDSPINARYPPDDFEPPLENHHRVELERLKKQEKSTDQSVNRIKQQIQKSRKLIQQFQLRNKQGSEATFD